MQILQITYSSRSLLDGENGDVFFDVGNIAIEAAVRNSERDIVGALLFDGLFFAQVLEGHPDQVRTLFRRIRRDPRHSDVTLIGARYVSEARFSEWSMGFLTLDRRFDDIFKSISLKSGIDFQGIGHDQLVGDIEAMLEAAPESSGDFPASGASASSPEAQAISSR